MLDFNYVLQLAGRDTDINEYLLSLYNIPVQRNDQVVVELGAGQSTYALTAAVNKTGGHLYSNDISSGAVLRGFPEGKGVLDDEPNITRIILDDLDLVKKWDKEIDFLFIDTTHTLENTRLELASWPKFVKSGGVIAMHDTMHKDHVQKGCRQALDEFMDSEVGKNYRVIHLLDQKHAGMGILFKL